MIFETLLVLHLILFILSIALLINGKIKNWPEFALLAAAVYSFSGFFVAGFIQHNHFGDMADLIVMLLAGGFILLCLIMTLMLIFHGLSKYSFTIKLCALILIVGLGNFSNAYYQQKKKAGLPKTEAPLDPENADIEAQNRALEQGVDPRSLNN